MTKDVVFVVVGIVGLATAYPSLCGYEIIRSPDFQKNIRPFLSERVRVNYTVDFDNWGGTIKPEDLSGFMRMRQLPPMLNVPCKNLFNFAVRHDGRVRLCGCRLTQNDNDDQVVGNIREKTLAEISPSSEAWEKIKGFYSGKRPETCVECTFYQPINPQWLEQRARQNRVVPENKQSGSPAGFLKNAGES